MFTELRLLLYSRFESGPTLIEADLDKTLPCPLYIAVANFNSRIF
jgi:hypothetical protein